jgi:ribonuclease E
VPLFTRYQIESQIETAFQREVRLPSGGAIVIDHTEAMISIDINSARATKGSDIEETAFNTNREAAEEIARQLRLRDLGGLIVIDFIDMTSSRNQREVENTLRDAMKMDRARVQLGRISRFGLLEMSRQRLRPSLGESSQIICPRCLGHGHIRGTGSLALSILRIIEEDAMKEQTARIVAQVPVNVATFLLNEKRQVISDIENRQRVKVILIPNPSFETPHFDIQRERISELTEEADTQISYELAVEREEVSESVAEKPRVKSEEPAVKGVVPATPVPVQVPKPAAAAPVSGGFIKRLWSNLVGGSAAAPAAEPAPEKTSTAKPPHRERPEREAGSHAGPGRRRPARRGEGGRRPQDKEGGQAAEGGAREPVTPPKEKEAGESRGRDRKPVPSEEVSEAQEQAQEQQPREHQEGQRSGSRRGRRGGRRRRREPGSQEEGTGSASPSSGTEQEARTEVPEPAESHSYERPRESADNPAGENRSAPVESPRPVSTPPLLSTPVIPPAPKPVVETAATRTEDNPPTRESSND